MKESSWFTSLSKGVQKKGRRVYKNLYKRSVRFWYGESWTGDGSQGAFLQRAYRTYGDYVAHQQSKLTIRNFSRYDTRYRQALRERVAQLTLVQPGMTVLCLAARIGTEVKAFLDLGCFAVGIDLNPGKENRYVVHGDFHNLQFPPQSVDVAFTNSLDHTFNIERLIQEIAKVLKPHGLLIIEAVRGSEEGHAPGLFESFYWPKIDALVSLFEHAHFTLIQRTAFVYPWEGEQLCFEKAGGTTLPPPLS